jgi:predicted 3-demethylubiquinone-9 3-methyltransferase (glyoxalase superfamily)
MSTTVAISPEIVVFTQQWALLLVILLFIIIKKEAIMATMQKITSCLWFDNQAEEAAKFYTSVFKDSSIGKISYYGNEGQEEHRQETGTIMTIEYELNGNKFLGLNGGPIFKFNEAVSFIISCKDQAEVDYYWEKLTAGGDPKAQQCGWLKDKYGLSWQVVPTELQDMVASEDKVKSGRMMEALMKMKKLDVAELEKAFNG